MLVQQAEKRQKSSKNRIQFDNIEKKQQGWSGRVFNNPV